MHYSTSNRLNDVQVEIIGYNPYKRYLAVAYTSHNIDLLYDNGRVVNLPDIRDANISADKTINAFDFTADGRMYVATGFGFVAFDDEKHRVADSGIYNTAFSYAGEIDGNIVLGKGNELYASPLDVRHNSLDVFKCIGKMSGTGAVFHRLGDRLLLGRNTVASSSNCYYLITPDFSAGTIAEKKIDNGVLRMDFTTGADGNVRFASGTVMRTVTPNGDITVDFLPDFFYGKSVTTDKGTSSIWAADVTGVGEYSIEGSDFTQLRAPSKPETLTCYWPAIMYISKDGNRIYVSNMVYNSFRGLKSSADFGIPQTTNIIENGIIRDVTCYNVDGTGKVMTGDAQNLVEDNNDPSVYYIANFQKGVYIIKNGEQIGHIASENLPYNESWAQWITDVKLDLEGNLWIGVWEAGTRNPIYILPAEKLKNPESVQKSDWLAPVVAPYRQSTGISSLMHSKTNFVIYGCNHNSKGLLVYDHNGTPTDFSDDTYHVFDTYIDQDGVQNKVKRIMRISEDKRGQIWVAHENGVCVIPDIATAIKNNELHMRRPKVARNDGTDFADYLLDGELVYDICADPSDRKWITTQTSGVYLVNADGTAIIENFTTDNSPIPSDKVLSVMCDPNNNIVYFGTDKGVVSYRSDAAPGAEDYSDVYAYPNPVRPDYNGWITVTGLMDNSLIKITDSAGNLVHQGSSEGGMFLWDGCNTSGQRVRSGVYFVFASQNSGNSASGKPVTKIMVIN